MRKTGIKAHIVLLIAGILCLLFMGCAKKPENTPTPGEPKTEKLRVVMPENPEFYEVVGPSTKKTEYGGIVSFTLKMKNDRFVSKVGRTGGDVEYEVRNVSDGSVQVIIKNVKFSFIANVECAVAKSFIAYHPNGGIYTDGTESGNPYVVSYSLDNRLRPNTEIGTDRFSREGYVQTGWNTKPDGSGEHVGLGSRVTAELGETLELYAEWAKESDPSDFGYRRYGKGITITAYTGRESCVVVPHEIDGSVVDTIAKGAFENAWKAEKVVLPSTIEVIADGAFGGAKLQELFIYDNVSYVSDKSFENCTELKTVHINAIEAPRYGQNLYSEYNLADKYDILILNRDKKKIIVFGGSGAYFSVNAKMIEKSFAGSGDYICINMAVNGWFNGPAQFEMMRAYLTEGDIFIHTPESSSGYSLMYDVTMTPAGTGFDYNRLRFYYCTESNYDLLSLIDIRNVTDFFNGFNAFNLAREDLEEKSYTDYKSKIKWYGGNIENPLGYIDDRGSMVLPKKAGSSTERGEADIVVEYVTDRIANSRLNAYYDSLRQKGVTVFFMTAPVNKDTLLERLAGDEKFSRTSSDGVLYYGRMPGIADPDYDSLEKWVETYEKAVSEHLECEVLLPLSKTLYTTKDYFEPDYHLADGMDDIYTLDIINALKEALKQ